MFTDSAEKLVDAKLVSTLLNMEGAELKNTEFIGKTETGFCSKWYKPPASLPTPIVLQLVRCWTKQNFDKKMIQHCRVLINLLTDIKLNEKEGMQSTLVKTKVSEILMVPM